MATKNVAQARRDAKRPVGEPPVVTVQLPIAQWRKLFGASFIGPPMVTVSLPIAQWRKLLGKMSVRDFAAKLPARNDGSPWSFSYISRVETGLRGGSDELIKAVQKFITDVAGSN